MANASWTEINNWLDNVAKDIKLSIIRDEHPDTLEGHVWRIDAMVMRNPIRPGGFAHGATLQEALTNLKNGMNIGE